MLKWRRDIADWPVKQIAKLTVACFTSDPDEYEVHAAAVLHLDPSLLPKGVESDAFNVFGFAFHDEDRTGLYMEGDPTVLVKMHEGAESLDEAEQLALGWCGEGSSKRPLHNIPGIYQVAYMQQITGNHQLGGSGEFGWAIERGPKGYDVVREFPPKLTGGEDDAQGQPKFAVLPSEVVDGFQREFGW
jgi:hypothetical protein